MTTYTSQYPPAHNSTYVKATTAYPEFLPHFGTNPALSVIGSSQYNAWVSDAVATNQRFHIDLGSAKIIRRLYFQNYHNSGDDLGNGAKNFTLQGSNNASSFAELTYDTNTGWTDISLDILAVHSSTDQSEPQYFLTGNETEYRYYALKFPNNYGGGYLGFRRLELQTEDGYGAGGQTLPRFRGYVLA